MDKAHEQFRQSKLQLEIATTTQKGIFQITIFDGKAVVGDVKLDFQVLLIKLFKLY